MNNNQYRSMYEQIQQQPITRGEQLRQGNLLGVQRSYGIEIMSIDDLAYVAGEQTIISKSPHLLATPDGVEYLEKNSTLIPSWNDHDALDLFLDSKTTSWNSIDALFNETVYSITFAQKRDILAHAKESYLGLLREHNEEFLPNAA